MACQIKRNKDGNITKVLAPNGQESQLFKAINENIFMADAETSVKIMNNAYAEKVEKAFEGQEKNKYSTGEPQLFYKSETGKVYDNLEEALINEDFGQVQMGFRNPSNDEFMPVAKFTTKGSKKNEFLHSKVREGLLSAERTVDTDGTVRYRGKGAYDNTRLVTAHFVARDLAGELGSSKIQIYTDGSIDMNFAEGYSEVIDEDGNTQIVKTENLPEYLEQNPNVQNKADLALEYVVNHSNPIPVDKADKRETAPSTNLTEIEDALFGFLESLGISVMSIEEYRESHNTKFGDGRHIGAMVDLANSIVAYTEGRISVDDLTEEVAHIATAAYSDQKAISAALANVHLTPEYNEFAEKYRQIYRDAHRKAYSEEIDPVALEDKVRKEILGKLLKKEIANRFSTENKTEEQAFLISKLREIWNWFTTKIRNALKPYHLRYLEEINEDIADSILNKATEDFQADKAEFGDFFYNLMDNKGLTMENELKKSKTQIERLYNSVIKEPVPNQFELDRIANSMASLDIVSSVNAVTNIASRQLNALDSAIQRAKKDNEVLSMKDTNRYQVLDQNLLPTVNNLIAGLKEMISSKEAMNQFGVNEKVKQDIERIITSAEELSVKKASVDPFINDNKLEMVDQIVDEVLSTFSLTEEQKTKVRDAVEGGYRDLGWMGKMFGLASHSKNMVLQLLHRAVTKVAANTNRKFLKRMNEFLSKVVDKNITRYQAEIIHRDENGKKTHYFLSPRDYEFVDKEVRKVENETIADLTGLTVEQVGKRRKDGELPIEIITDRKDPEVTTRRQEALKKAVTDRKLELLERRFSEKYYSDRDARYAKANVSDYTQDYLTRKNTAMNFRHKQAGVINPDGTKDLSKLSEADRELDVEDYNKHARVASAYDSMGNLKDGLVVKNMADLTEAERNSIPVEIDPDYTGDVILLESNRVLDEIAPDARIALDIFNLNMLYRSELKEAAKSNKAVERFLTEIKELEAQGKSSFDWVASNASIGLTNTFYESMGANPRYVDIAQAYVDSIADPQDRMEKQDYLDEYIASQRSRKALLKQNRKPGNAIETDVHNMSPTVMKKVRELDDKIAELRRDIGVPSENFEEVGGIDVGTTDLTDDFYRMFEESSDDLYKFALRHMSENSRDRVKKFSKQVDLFVKGQQTYIRKDFEEFVSGMMASGMLAGKTKEEIIQTLKEEYAKKNVASYFNRFQPQGYTELMNDLKSGKVKMSDVIENKESLVSEYPALNYVEITPDYSWREDVNNLEYVNPNFKSGDTFFQPKKLNERFFDRYGISKDDYLALEDEDISKLTATKNKEEFAYLVETIKMRKETIENYNDTGRVNPYMRTQMRKEATERFLQLHKVGTAGIKDWIADFATSQIDEKEYGEQIEGTDINVKLIPKYYQTRIEDPELLTDNVLQASLMDLKASIRYKERSAVESEVKALEYKIAQQDFKSRGGKRSKSRIVKKGEVSAYYEKAQEMVDYHLYGIRQNRQMTMDVWGKEIHLDQVFSRITEYVRNVNLAYNPLVDITSYTTGVVNNLVDTFAGDYYHKSSAAKATKRLPSMIAKFMSEEGKLDKKSELGHLMEFYNISTPEEERLLMSAYNRGVRIASNSFYLGSKVANLPVTPRNMLAMLYDYKYHNGRFKSFNEFARDLRAVEGQKSMKTKQVLAQWNKIDDTFYSNLNIDRDLGVSYNEKFRQKFETEEQAEQAFEDLNVQLTAKMSQINQSVDAIISNEDQIAAQRDALANAFMLHRSWFIINMTRKLKGEHFNMSTGQFERGHYTGLVTMFKKMGQGLLSKDRKPLTEILEEYEVRNLKRLGVDAVAVAILVSLTNMLMADDDDDDTYVEDLAQLIAMRTTNETFSQNIFGMTTNAYDIYKDPLVQARSFENIFKFVSDPTNEKQQEKALKQLLLFRRYKQLDNLQYQLDAYMHFNKSSLWGVTAAQKKKSER